jgi:hypothetical protein
MITVGEVERIGKIENPVLRNLLITQCYHDLSKAFSSSSPRSANWCTFATWASRQAGQTIRKEDLQRRLQTALQINQEVISLLKLIAAVIKRSSANLVFEELHNSVITELAGRTATKAADAVARGNKKVFDEIGLEFARYLSGPANDPVYSKSSIDSFCEQFREGQPPEGQQYLCNAFRRYYEAKFENQVKKKAELQFLANVEIGFHEQTRLQPEIAEALTATVIERSILKQRIQELMQRWSIRNRIIGIFQSLLSQTTLLDKYIDLLSALTGKIMRQIMTTHLMTLTFPPGRALVLGADLSADYPASLLKLDYPEALKFIALVDPTPDSLVASGATDWANLGERIHFICDLFRCHHENEQLFEYAFTKEQQAQIASGSVPASFEW